MGMKSNKESSIVGADSANGDIFATTCHNHHLSHRCNFFLLFFSLTPNELSSHKTKSALIPTFFFQRWYFDGQQEDHS
jgi:hypothetical protein